MASTLLIQRTTPRTRLRGGTRSCALILISLAHVSCAGWMAYRRPEVEGRAVDVDAGTMDSLRRIRVVVRPGQFASQYETLATCLRKTGVFGDVVETDTERKVQLVASVVETVHQPQMPALIPLFTFGFLPEWGEARAGFVIRLSSLPNAPQLMEFDCRFDTVTVQGWPSMFLTPFAAFATCGWWEPEETQEFADFVKAKMLAKARDLVLLAGADADHVK